MIGRAVQKASFFAAATLATMASCVRKTLKKPELIAPTRELLVEQLPTHATPRRSSSRLSHLPTRFQLAKVWLAG